MAKVTMICGRICSGKTTYAGKLCREYGGVLLSIDEVMLSIFGLYAGEKHDEYAAGTERYLLNKAVELVENGVNVVLDWGPWNRNGRAAIRSYFESRGIDYTVHYIEVDDACWLERLQKRNAAILRGEELAYIVDDNLAGKFAGLFEVPGEDEYDLKITE